MRYFPFVFLFFGLGSSKLIEMKLQLECEACKVVARGVDQELYNVTLNRERVKVGGRMGTTTHGGKHVKYAGSVMQTEALAEDICQNEWVLHHDRVGEVDGKETIVQSGKKFLSFGVHER